MALTIRSTIQTETVEVDIVDGYALIENDNFMYLVDLDVVEENNLMDDDVLNGDKGDIYLFADIVIRKSDKVVTKSRFF